MGRLLWCRWALRALAGAGAERLALISMLTNSQGDGLMAYISRKDCAKAVAYVLFRGEKYHEVALDINGPELMTISQFIEIGARHSEDA